eukprot:TRINITY_DN10216_c0_g1_i1.p1 TRINITY_DN10216_c0_g1~~TRINITY_DN10216_c0_g1_i1.p1  ORF type:complete len:1088 (+),score=262.23 TRINITY_DN10216_c0_g1_i1:117-3380(+)
MSHRISASPGKTLVPPSPAPRSVSRQSRTSVAEDDPGTPSLGRSQSVSNVGSIKSPQPKFVPVGPATGRVRVVIRIRPALSAEEQSAQNVLSWKDGALSLKDPSFGVPRQDLPSDAPSSNEPTRQFHFDEILGPTTSQGEVFDHVGTAICKDVMSGYNGTIMAYGQTGAGKTHTLSNQKAPEQGVIPRAVTFLFEQMDADKDYEYTLLCSYLQIYNECVYDLLAKDTKTALALRESPTDGVYVEDLTEYVVRSPHEVLDLINKGKERLVFAETKMNRTSSRSHAVCRLVCERRERSKDSAVVLRGKLMMIDLAGSERVKKSGVEGQRFQEAVNINLSLTVLGLCIHALSESKPHHIPYRDSKLTRLIQDSLGGNAKTSLIICVSPNPDSFQPTLGSLRFAERAMKVKINATVNRKIDFERFALELEAQLTKVQAEGAQLRRFFALTTRTLSDRVDSLQGACDGMLSVSGQATDKTREQLQALATNMSQAFLQRIHTLEQALDITQQYHQADVAMLSRQRHTLMQAFSAIASSLLAHMVNIVFPQSLTATVREMIGAHPGVREQLLAEWGNSLSKAQLFAELHERLHSALIDVVSSSNRNLHDALDVAVPHQSLPSAGDAMLERLARAGTHNRDRDSMNSSQVTNARSGSPGSVPNTPLSISTPQADGRFNSQLPSTPTAATALGVVKPAAVRARSLQELFGDASGQQQSQDSATVEPSDIVIAVKGDQAAPPSAPAASAEEEIPSAEVVTGQLQSVVSVLDGVMGTVQLLRASVSPDGDALEALVSSLQTASRHTFANARRSQSSINVTIEDEGENSDVHNLVTSATQVVSYLREAVDRHVRRYVEAFLDNSLVESVNSDSMGATLLNEAQQEVSEYSIQSAHVVERTEVDELLTELQYELNRSKAQEMLEERVAAQGDKLQKVADKRSREIEHREKLEKRMQRLSRFVPEQVLSSLQDDEDGDSEPTEISLAVPPTPTPIPVAPTPATPVTPAASIATPTANAAAGATSPLDEISSPRAALRARLAAMNEVELRDMLIDRDGEWRDQRSRQDTMEAMLKRLEADLEAERKRRELVETTKKGCCTVM